MSDAKEREEPWWDSGVVESDTDHSLRRVLNFVCEAMGVAAYANGVESSSPGLVRRRSAYPGMQSAGANPEGVASYPRIASDQPSLNSIRRNPFRVGCCIWISQGSSCLATLG